MSSVEQKIRYFSMFSGIGGFELGIQNAFKACGKTEPTTDVAGHLPDNPIHATQKRRQSATCVGYSEIDKYAIKTYEEATVN
jgi:site-specific DNA-cytosine methylase